MPRLVNRPQAAGQVQPLLPNLQEFILEDRCCMSAAEVTEMLSSRIQNFSTGVWGRSSSSSSTNQGQPPLTAGLRVVRLNLSRPAAPKFPELDLLKQVAENHGVDISIHSA